MSKTVDCGKLANEIDELETKEMKLKADIIEQKQSCSEETESVINKFNKKLDEITTVVEEKGRKKQKYDMEC